MYIYNSLALIYYNIYVSAHPPILQFKMFFMGAFLFGDFPLFQKILAALLTGQLFYQPSEPSESSLNYILKIPHICRIDLCLYNVINFIV